MPECQLDISKHLFTLLKVKLIVFFIGSMTMSFLVVFEIASLNIVSIKSCRTWIIDHSHWLPTSLHLFLICIEFVVKGCHIFHTTQLYYQYLQGNCKQKVGISGPVFSDLLKHAVLFSFFHMRTHWVHHHLQIS